MKQNLSSFMNFPFSEALLKTALEDTPSFIGVYNTVIDQFVHINQVGLRMLEVSDLEEFVLVQLKLLMLSQKH